MKILFIGVNNSPDDINEKIISALESIGHDVIRYNYIKMAERLTKKGRNKDLRKTYYEVKPDIVFLSKGNSISTDCIEKISKKTPMIFLIYKSRRSFRMHPEIDYFIYISDITIVTDKNVYKHYKYGGNDSIFYIEEKEKGVYKVKTDVNIEGTNYEKYKPVDIKAKNQKDVVYLGKEIDESREEHQETINNMDMMDRNDIDKFRKTCSETKLFVVSEGFSANFPELYRKMTLSGALILEGDEEKEIPDLLRYYMKRKSLLNKRIQVESEKILKESSSGSEEGLDIKSLASMFIDAVVERTKSKK